MFQIGTSLREARIRRGLELRDVEAVTRIRPRYLQALEEEQFDLLPSPTYVKGFMRTYAEFLGLDGQLYVDEYNSRYVQGDEESLAIRRRGTTPSRAQRRVESGALVLALLGIVAAAGLVVLAWKWAGEGAERVPGQAPSSPPASVSPQPAAGEGTEKRWLKLTLVAERGSTELTVYRGRGPVGEPLFDGTLVEGSTHQYTGPRLWFRVARPRMLRAEIDGHPTPLNAGTTGPATLAVTRRGIRSASE